MHPRRTQASPSFRASESRRGTVGARQPRSLSCLRPPGQQFKRSKAAFWSPSCHNKIKTKISALRLLATSSPKCAATSNRFCQKQQEKQRRGARALGRCRVPGPRRSGASSLGCPPPPFPTPLLLASLSFTQLHAPLVLSFQCLLLSFVSPLTLLSYSVLLRFSCCSRPPPDTVPRFPFPLSQSAAGNGCGDLAPGWRPAGPRSGKCGPTQPVEGSGLPRPLADAEAEARCWVQQSQCPQPSSEPQTCVPMSCGRSGRRPWNVFGAASTSLYSDEAVRIFSPLSRV